MAITKTKRKLSGSTIAIIALSVLLAITVSIGVAEFKNEKDHEMLYKKADNALYEAKETGRNRVIIAN